MFSADAVVCVGQILHGCATHLALGLNSHGWEMHVRRWQRIMRRADQHRQQQQQQQQQQWRHWVSSGQWNDDAWSRRLYCVLLSGNLLPADQLCCCCCCCDCCLAKLSWAGGAAGEWTDQALARRWRSDWWDGGLWRSATQPAFQQYGVGRSASWVSEWVTLRCEKPAHVTLALIVGAVLAGCRQHCARQSRRPAGGTLACWVVAYTCSHHWTSPALLPLRRQWAARVSSARGHVIRRVPAPAAAAAAIFAVSDVIGRCRWQPNRRHHRCNDATPDTVYTT